MIFFTKLIFLFIPSFILLLYFVLVFGLFMMQTLILTESICHLVIFSHGHSLIIAGHWVYVKPPQLSSAEDVSIQINTCKTITKNTVE